MNKKMILIIGMAAILLAVLAYLYVSFEDTPGRNEPSMVRHEMTAYDFYRLFADDADMASKQFMNQEITLFGEISGIIDEQIFVLESHVLCYFADEPNAHLEDFAPATTIKVRGKLTGHDTTAGTIRLDKCVVLWE
jgi:hypothetical protein